MRRGEFIFEGILVGSGGVEKGGEVFWYLIGEIGGKLVSWSYGNSERRID